MSLCQRTSRAQSYYTPSLQLPGSVCEKKAERTFLDKNVGQLFDFLFGFGSNSYTERLHGDFYLLRVRLNKWFIKFFSMSDCYHQWKYNLRLALCRIAGSHASEGSIFLYFRNTIVFHELLFFSLNCSREAFGSLICLTVISTPFTRWSSLGFDLISGSTVEGRLMNAFHAIWLKSFSF